MIKAAWILFICAYLPAVLLPAAADPVLDRLALRAYYRTKFPAVEIEAFADGVYAIDSDARSSWEAIEEFPPYEPAIERGETLFNETFADGKTYSDCFPDDGIAIAQQYPRWNKKRGAVETLARAINDCRAAHGEKPLPYEKGALADLLAYMAFTSRGKPVSVVIPDDDFRALEAYEAGKRFYYTRRGQLNFSCATCHVQNAGKRLRAETLSPAIGHTTGWPVYRLKWGEVGTLHRRFAECMTQIRAEPLAPQSPEYSNLEYFLSFISNGLPINGPSTRK